MAQQSKKKQASPARSRIADLDLTVGRRLRERRNELGLTLEEVGKLVELSSQQIHKYESGQIRVPAARLNIFSQALHMPLGHFFQENVDTILEPDEIRLRHEVMTLLEQFQDPKKRILFLKLIKGLVPIVTQVLD